MLIRRTYIHHVGFTVNNNPWKMSWKWNFKFWGNYYLCHLFICLYFDSHAVAVLCLTFRYVSLTMVSSVLFIYFFALWQALWWKLSENRGHEWISKIFCDASLPYLLQLQIVWNLARKIFWSCRIPKCILRFLVTLDLC